MTTVLLVSFAVLLLLNVPVAFCMLLSSLAALLYEGINPIMMALETSRSLSNFYAFLAVPFFILAGEIMSQGGLSRSLITFVRALIGHRKSGLPMVTVISSQMFGAVSGASAATCAAIGGMMIPALEKNGYPRPFATGLAACAGTTGALIPPSIALLLYGTIANVSIEKLFIGGVGPGILIGVGLMVVSWLSVRKFNIQTEAKSSWRDKIGSAQRSILALFLAVIIFVGIMGGYFTATEASAVAVVYALAISLVVYRQLRLRNLPALFVTAAKTTAALSFLLACASLFSWTLGIGKVPDIITQALLSGCDSALSGLASSLSPETYALVRKLVILGVLNVALLVVGMFIDVGPGLLIVVPVLIPISEAIGMHTGLSAVHFGVMVVSNMVIGLVTPPVGTTLFVASAVGKVGVSEMVPHVLRFLLAMIVVQLLIIYVPFVTTALPSLMK
ncbi:MAG: TRAP transporter large permease [Sedimentisphaerales bacterium]|nr:TRAP transporter large permease [Sedimentisphaerales bacterium]